MVVWCGGKCVVVEGRVVVECVLCLSATIMGWRPRRKISKLPAHLSLTAAMFVSVVVFYRVILWLVA